MNTDFSITILNSRLKLKEDIYDVLFEESVSQIFNLGLSYIFMTQTVNNGEKYICQNFYITLKKNQDLNQNFETRFPQEYHREHSLLI